MRNDLLKRELRLWVKSRVCFGSALICALLPAVSLVISGIQITGEHGTMAELQMDYLNFIMTLYPYLAAIAATVYLGEDYSNKTFGLRALRDELFPVLIVRMTISAAVSMAGMWLPYLAAIAVCGMTTDAVIAGVMLDMAATVLLFQAVSAIVTIVCRNTVPAVCLTVFCFVLSNAAGIGYAKLLEILAHAMLTNDVWKAVWMAALLLLTDGLLTGAVKGICRIRRV